MLANKTLEDVRKDITDWVEGFGVDAKPYEEAINRLALLTECEVVSHLFQRLSLQTSFGALSQENNVAMKMGVAHCFNDLSSVLRT